MIVEQAVRTVEYDSACTVPLGDSGESELQT